MELWLILAILGFLFYATSSSIDKYLMNHKFGVLRTNTLKMFFDGLIVLAIGLLFFELNINLNLILLSLPLGIIYGVSGIVYYNSLKLKDVEQVIPSWQSLSILFIFIFSIVLFNESVNMFNFLGIILLFIGIYAILSKTGFTVPTLDKGFILIILIVILDVIHALFVKRLLFNIQPINLAIMMYFFATLVLLFYKIIFKKHTKERVYNIKTLKILAASFFGAMGTLLIYSALAIGNASKVYPIAGLESVFIFIVASMFLKEKFYWHRLAGVIVIVFGIFLISI